jgi:ABC-type uncharacterized transport system auxiliary subunit
MLDIKTPKKLSTKAPRKNLMVRSTVIIPQFSNLNFVYRTSKIQYSTDHYNEFYTLPATLINQAIVKYLTATKLFHFVTNDSRPIRIKYLLTSKVTELYADYRNRFQPKAIMTIQFSLFKINHPDRNIILLNKTFTATSPLQQKNSQSLVNAWNKDLAIILRRLAHDLRRIR